MSPPRFHGHGRTALTRNLVSRICIITLLRIIIINDMDLTNFTYGAAALARWSVLEPTLGIVNACLPLMRPVIQKFHKANILSWIKCTKGARKESSSKRRWFNGSKWTSGDTDETDKQSFRRLADHLYPLEDDPVVRSQTVIGRVSPAHHSQGHAKHVIEITTRWDLHSTV